MAGRKRTSAKGNGGLVAAIVVVIAIIGGISSLANHGQSTPSLPDNYNDSTDAPTPDTYVPDTYIPDTYVPDSAVDTFAPDTEAAPGGGGDSNDDGGVNPPGHFYVDGPGVDCHLSGCHVHVLPHLGFHF